MDVMLGSASPPRSRYHTRNRSHAPSEVAPELPEADLSKSRPQDFTFCVFCTDPISRNDPGTKQRCDLLSDEFAEVLKIPSSLLSAIQNYEVCEKCWKGFERLACLTDEVRALEVQIQNLNDEIDTNLALTLDEKYEIYLEQKDTLEHVESLRDQLSKSRAVRGSRMKTHYQVRNDGDGSMENLVDGGDDFAANSFFDIDDQGSLDLNATSTPSFKDVKVAVLSSEGLQPFHRLSDPTEEQGSTAIQMEINQANSASKIESSSQGESDVSQEVPSKRRRIALTRKGKQITCDFTDLVTNKCALKLNSEEKMEAHLKSHHLRIRLRKCDEPRRGRPRSKTSNSETPRRRRQISCTFKDCGRVMDRSRFTDHVTTVHNYLVCRARNQDRLRCYKYFATEEELAEHQMSAHSNRDFEDEALHRPLREKEGPPLLKAVPEGVPLSPDVLLLPDEPLSWQMCQLCRRPKLKGLYPGHMARHGFYVCLKRNLSNELCSETFEGKEQLTSHFKTEHNDMCEDLAEMSCAVPFVSSNKCTLCGKPKLKSAVAFKHHISGHGFFPCGQKITNSMFCKRFFRSEYLLNLHVKSCKFANPELPIQRGMCCRFCKVLIHGDRDQWVEHIQSHNAYVCNFVDENSEKPCNKVEVSEALLKLHRQNQHKVAIVEPPVTDVGATTVDLESELCPETPVNEHNPEAREDAQLLEPIMRPCSFCDQTFGSTVLWKSHIESHGAFVCDVSENKDQQMCLEVFLAATALQHHVRFKHSKANQAAAPYFCSECNYGSPYYRTFLNHLNRHHGKKQERICEICGEACVSVKAVYRHKVSVHGEKTPHHCEICDKYFTSAFYYKEHAKYTHEGATVSCPICNISFPTPGKFSHHVAKMHTKSTSCDVCKREFPSLSTLNHHKRIAHVGRRFACTQCDWTFATNCRLQNHIRNVHEGARPYVCDICGATTKRLGHMKTHKKKHEDGIINVELKPRTRRIKTPVKEIPGTD